MAKSKHTRKGNLPFHPTPPRGPSVISRPKEQIRLLVWGATPYVITGFGIVMKEVFQNLFKLYPGVYNIDQVAINFHGDHCEEFEITGRLENGRFRQWPAASQIQGGGVNLYGQPKFLQLLRNYQGEFDAIFLAEDPFWIGGGIPGMPPGQMFIDLIKAELATKGLSHIPIIGYFPIDGTPKPSWIHNISKLDIPITYLTFGANECIKAVPTLNGRIGIIPLGVNTKNFYPLPKEEIKTFKRAFFGDKVSDWFMFLNVNRNQLRKLIPSNLIAFKEFKTQVPNSFMYLNMQAMDVGWNLVEVCQSLGLQVGKDVFFPPNFNVQKGLSTEDLNKVFNAADILTSTAVGGGWELSVTQAFATKTSVLVPANTSHIELCGNQNSAEEIRGKLFKSGSNLAQLITFPSDNEVVRPLPDLDDLVNQMLWMYNNQEFCRKMEENALKWVQTTLSWEKNITPQFHKAFSLAKKMKEERIAQLQKK